jgi:hypothetical protein
MDDFKSRFELACRIGEEHSKRAIAFANEASALRRAIWKALIQLRSGRIEQARHTLEQQIKKDSE